MNNDALYFSISARGLPFKKTYQRYKTVFLARATRLQKQTDCKIHSKNINSNRFQEKQNSGSMDISIVLSKFKFKRIPSEYHKF